MNIKKPFFWKKAKAKDRLKEKNMKTGKLHKSLQVDRDHQYQKTGIGKSITLRLVTYSDVQNQCVHS